MKWIALVPVALILSACCCTNREVIAYKQVLVAPPCETVSVVDVEPVDVTTTTVQYY